ncbi:DUF6221 family protein [Streptomyces sp. NPDC004330]|uniref:DUF6221 family protein n=1 Tax=Streptomyces sp. NPDC004330 TaxID=3364700 RepID=UPI0036741AEE
MEDLITFLRARLDEDERWAGEASRRHGQAAIEGGVHWQWVNPETDKTITPAPDLDEFVGGEDNFRVSLRSRETWPNPPWELPQFAIPTAEEVPAAVGGHIVRHDPARVLAEVEAKRRIIALCEPPLVDVTGLGDAERQYMPGQGDPWGVDVLRLLALPYASHPGYRDTWRS